MKPKTAIIRDLPEPIRLNYSIQTPAMSSWPVVTYFVAITWAMLTMYAYVAMSIPYKDDQVAQWRAQFALVTLAGLRFAWARFRREQGRVWVLYVTVLAMAPVLWAGFVSCLRMIR